MTVSKNSTLLDPYGGGSSSTSFTTPATVTLAVAATSTDGLILKTDQTASAGAQKFSPALHFQGSGWKTNATAGAQSCDWKIEVEPSESGASPVNYLVLKQSINGAAYTNVMNIASGEIYLTGSVNLHDSNGTKFACFFGTGVVSCNRTAGGIYFNAGNTNIQDTGLSSPSAGVVVVGNGTAGDVGGTLKAANINSSVATGSIGFITGAGGTVTQATSKSTGVTLSKPCGAITLHTASIATNTSVSFVMTCTAVAAGDVMILNHIAGGTINAYHLNAQCGAGVATINVRNLTAAALGEAITIQYVIVKAVTA